MTLIINSKDETTAFLVGPADIISEIAKCFQFQPEGYMFMPGYRMGYWSGWIYPVNKKTGEFKKGLAGFSCYYILWHAERGRCTATTGVYS